MTLAPGTNFFFNNFSASNEQGLLTDLIVESIKIYGIDLYYCPRTLNQYDPILGEDAQSSYDKAIPIEMYIRSVDGFEGDGTFLSKFGLEIRDQVVFTVARRTFDENISGIYSIPRPNEGDLIYYPLNGKLFQIKYTDYLPLHYPLGTLMIYNLTCELFAYSNERMNTGVPAIDILQTEFSTNIIDYAIMDERGNYLIDENGDYIVSEKYAINQANTATVGGDNEVIQIGSDDNVIDFSEKDPFSEGNI